MIQLLEAFEQWSGRAEQPGVAVQILPIPRISQRGRGVTVHTVTKPLFIPLRTQYFEAFKSGVKSIEFRPYGPRWNERTCCIGRPVVLSKGYGKHSRLRGTIVGFLRSPVSPNWKAWRDCYGDRGGEVASIYIELRSDDERVL